MYLSSTVDENVVQTDEKRKLQGQGKLGYVRVVSTGAHALDI